MFDEADLMRLERSVTVLRNHRLIDLGADRRRNVRKAVRTNTLGVRTF
jgi:hypothetical protein